MNRRKAALLSGLALAVVSFIAGLAFRFSAPPDAVRSAPVLTPPAVEPEAESEVAETEPQVRREESVPEQRAARPARELRIRRAESSPPQVPGPDDFSRPLADLFDELEAAAATNAGTAWWLWLALENCPSTFREGPAWDGEIDIRAGQASDDPAEFSAALSARCSGLTDGHDARALEMLGRHYTEPKLALTYALETYERSPDQGRPLLESMWQQGYVQAMTALAAEDDGYKAASLIFFIGHPGLSAERARAEHVRSLETLRNSIPPYRWEETLRRAEQILSNPNCCKL